MNLLRSLIFMLGCCLAMEHFIVPYGVIEIMPDAIKNALTKLQNLSVWEGTTVQSKLYHVADWFASNEYKELCHQILTDSRANLKNLKTVAIQRGNSSLIDILFEMGQAGASDCLAHIKTLFIDRDHPGNSFVAEGHKFLILKPDAVESVLPILEGLLQLKYSPEAVIEIEELLLRLLIGRLNVKLLDVMRRSRHFPAPRANNSMEETFIQVFRLASANSHDLVGPRILARVLYHWPRLRERLTLRYGNVILEAVKAKNMGNFILITTHQDGFNRMMNDEFIAKFGQAAVLFAPKALTIELAKKKTGGQPCRQSYIHALLEEFPQSPSVHGALMGVASKAEIEQMIVDGIKTGNTGIITAAMWLGRLKPRHISLIHASSKFNDAHLCFLINKYFGTVDLGKISYREIGRIPIVILPFLTSPSHSVRRAIHVLLSKASRLAPFAFLDLLDELFQLAADEAAVCAQLSPLLRPIFRLDPVYFNVATMTANIFQLVMAMKALGQHKLALELLSLANGDVRIAILQASMSANDVPMCLYMAELVLKYGDADSA